MGKVIEMKGKSFSDWTVLNQAGKDKHNKALWLCRCKCGTVKQVVGADLRAGKSTGCGCEKDNKTSKRSKTHGESGTHLYEVWKAMRQRCSNPNNKDYKYYGEKGVVVGDIWNSSFKAFKEWANDSGYREGLQLDRIDGAGNYEPSNCRFIGARTNILNRTIFHSNTSGFKGVFFHKRDKKWQAGITINRKQVYLGIYDKKEDAVKARNKYIADNGLYEYM